MTTERIALSYLGLLAEIRWVPDSAVPPDVVEALGSLVEAVEMAGIQGRRLTRAGADVVLGWRPIEGRLLADTGIWLSRHVKAGHLTIKRGRGTTLHAIVNVSAAPFPWTAPGEESLRDWSKVQAGVYARFVAS